MLEHKMKRCKSSVKLEQEHRALYTALKSWAFYIVSDRNEEVNKVRKFVK